MDRSLVAQLAAAYLPPIRSKETILHRYDILDVDAGQTR